MITAKIKKQIAYINSHLENASAININCTLSTNEVKELSKHFKIENQPFGYKRFSKIE